MADAILVVDDDDAVRHVLEMNLMTQGYEVVGARDGAEALDVARRHAPSLVLLDVMMPVLNGIDVCKALRADHRTHMATIIVLTASGERDDLFAALCSGADDYVTKPFDVDEVLLRVEAGLRRAASLRATSPLTGLPGNAEIARHLERLMADPKHDFALVHVDLDHFKAYNDRYGFVRGDHAIRTTGQLLVSAVAEVQEGGAFVGHIGGDDFALLLPASAAEQVAAEVVAAFDVVAPSLYDPADARRGFIEVCDRAGQPRRFPLLAISLGIATTAHRRFVSPGEIAAAAGETKRRAKENPRSSWWVDRRTGSGPPAFSLIEGVPSQVLAGSEAEDAGIIRGMNAVR